MKTARRWVLLLTLLSANISAAPRFEDFRAVPYTGRHAAIRLQEAQSHRYASRLRAAANEPVNFAGRYVLTTWGCGASCVMGAAIDLETGGVAWLPFTVCCWNLEIIEPLEFRSDSRLLIVHGSLNEKGPRSGTHYYHFDGRKFHRLENDN